MSTRLLEIMHTFPPSPPHAFPALNTRNVLSGPEPRSVTFDLLLKVMPEDRLKVPGPSRTYWLAPQEAMALLMVVGAPEYAAIVEPHCVRPVGIPPLTPTRLQSITRLGARTLWALSCVQKDAPARRKSNALLI
jgi:hypothetical protein